MLSDSFMIDHETILMFGVNTEYPFLYYLVSGL
jgi:hypothetical protein